jgi:2-polyprenyl-3-methyl-5-hydroxy-6-metoxy-1,4-benzoquinol methylase
MISKIPYANPRNGLILNFYEEGASIVASDASGEQFIVRDGILRVSYEKNYADSFGFQWQSFCATQIDSLNNSKCSEQRLLAETKWIPEVLTNLHILEVGCGAGRFTDILLRKTEAHIYSIDYSSAVEVARENNKFFRNRLSVAQASILEIPFPKNSFDKVLCLGVLQHTASVEQSIRALVKQAKLNGEIVVDFYQLRGWYTWIHAKYLFRLITPRIPPNLLLKLIRSNIGWLLMVFDTLCLLNLGVLTRLLPIADLRGLPEGINREQRIEWAILDTFDALSPVYDKPQRISKIASYFRANGCEITFSGVVDLVGSRAAVVRAKKIAYLQD